jgi:hypothetical protein
MILVTEAVAVRVAHAIDNVSLKDGTPLAKTVRAKRHPPTNKWMKFALTVKPYQLFGITGFVNYIQGLFINANVTISKRWCKLAQEN